MPIFKQPLKSFKISPETLVIITTLYCTLGLNHSFWLKIYQFSKQILFNRYYFIINMVAISILLNFLWINWLLWKGRSAKYISFGLISVCVLANYFCTRYGVNFDRSMMNNIFATDIKETLELLTINILLNYLKLALPSIIILSLLQIKPTPWLILFKRKIILTIIVTLLIFGIILQQFKNYSSIIKQYPEIKYKLLPLSLMVATIRNVITNNFNLNITNSTINPIDPTAFRNSAKITQLPLSVIVVVGETVRAHNWGISGYQRQTTPELAKLPIINFSYTTSCGTNTEVSLPCMFSPYGRNNYNSKKINNTESILHLLSTLNIDVAWIDNQSGCKGVCSGLKTLPGYHFDYAHQFCNNHNDCFDEVLIEGLKTNILNTNQDQIIVLHQLGNHGPAYFKRSPKKFHLFTPVCTSNDLVNCSKQSIINAYDNAILYTDHILSEMIKHLQQIKTRHIFFIYLSDHGESLGENNIYLHGMPYSIAPTEQKRVPMFFWHSDKFPLNKQCLNRKASNPASHDNLYHTLLGIFQIKSSSYNANYDLLQSCYLSTFSDNS